MFTKLLLIFSNLIFISSSNQLKTYNFSLDSNPLERWNHILEDNKNKIPYIQSYLDTHINQKYQKYTNILGNLVSENLPKNYSDELIGISNKIKSFNNTNLTYGNIVLLNFAYELSKSDEKNYNPNYPPFRHCLYINCNIYKEYVFLIYKMKLIN